MGIPYITCYKLIPSNSLTDDLVPVKNYTESEIKGYIGSGSDNIIQVANQDTIETRFKFFSTDLTINLGDLIKYKDKTYEIVSEPKNTAFKNHHLKAMIRKVDNIKQQE